MSTTFIYRLLYLILGFSLLALLAVPVVVACQPLEKDARTRLDTRSLDGLRGPAAMHVAIGHYVSFTGLAGRFSDLQAGSSMGLFYLLSGFVMALGYGQKAVRPSHWLRLRQVLLRLLRRGLLLPPFCVSRAATRQPTRRSSLAGASSANGWRGCFPFTCSPTSQACPPSC